MHLDHVIPVTQFAGGALTDTATIGMWYYEGVGPMYDNQEGKGKPMFFINDFWAVCPSYLRELADPRRYVLNQPIDATQTRFHNLEILQCDGILPAIQQLLGDNIAATSPDFDDLMDVLNQVRRQDQNIQSQQFHRVPTVQTQHQYISIGAQANTKIPNFSIFGYSRDTKHDSKDYSAFGLKDQYKRYMVTQPYQNYYIIPKQRGDFNQKNASSGVLVDNSMDLFEQHHWVEGTDKFIEQQIRLYAYYMTIMHQQNPIPVMPPVNPTADEEDEAEDISQVKGLRQVYSAKEFGNPKSVVPAKGMFSEPFPFTKPCVENEEEILLLQSPLPVDLEAAIVKIPSYEEGAKSCAIDFEQFFLKHSKTTPWMDQVTFPTKDANTIPTNNSVFDTEKALHYIIISNDNLWELPDYAKYYLLIQGFKNQGIPLCSLHCMVEEVATTVSLARQFGLEVDMHDFISKDLLAAKRLFIFDNTKVHWIEFINSFKTLTKSLSDEDLTPNLTGPWEWVQANIAEFLRVCQLLGLQIEMNLHLAKYNTQPGNQKQAIIRQRQREAQQGRRVKLNKKLLQGNVSSAEKEIQVQQLEAQFQQENKEFHINSLLVNSDNTKMPETYLLELGVLFISTQTINKTKAMMSQTKSFVLWSFYMMAMFAWAQSQGEYRYSKDQSLDSMCRPINQYIFQMYRSEKAGNDPNAFYLNSESADPSTPSRKTRKRKAEK